MEITVQTLSMREEACVRDWECDDNDSSAVGKIRSARFDRNKEMLQVK